PNASVPSSSPSERSWGELVMGGPPTLSPERCDRGTGTIIALRAVCGENRKRWVSVSLSAHHRVSGALSSSPQRATVSAIRQRWGGLRRQCGLEHEPPRARLARDAMAHRGWDEAHWRKLRAGWPVARLCGARSNLVTGHRTSPPPRRPPNSLRCLVNDVHQPVASDAFRSTASRVNRRPGGWRRLIPRDQDASSSSLPDPLLRRWTNAPLRCDRTPFGAPCWPTPPTRRMPILPCWAPF